MRALIAGTQAQAADAAPLTTSVTVYRPARATWFGPGFYGKHTACGQVHEPRAARRRAPHAAVRHAGRALLRRQAITVPVIDRGPFANGARYDLTSAVAQAVGMTADEHRSASCPSAAPSWTRPSPRRRRSRAPAA